MKEGIGRIIVTRIGIIEDHTREVTGITIVFPIVESVVKGGLKIGMKMQKEEIIAIKTGIVMIDERKDVGKEVPVRKEDVEKGIVAIVGIAERGMIVGIVILIVRREKCLPAGQMGMALPKVCIVRKNKLNIARRTRGRRQNYA